ncbi:MAG: flagellar biosynthetic protein FliO, partial [Planctomycetota bacterium]
LLTFVFLLTAPMCHGQETSTPQQNSLEFPALVVPEDTAAGDSLQLGSGTSPVTTTVCALLVVLSLFGGFVWISRRMGAGSSAPAGIPEDVFRSLGSVALDAKSRAVFLRIGTKVVVVAQTASGESSTLTEITDPEEVERITNRCLGRPEIVGRRHSGGDTARMAG